MLSYSQLSHALQQHLARRELAVIHHQPENLRQLSENFLTKFIEDYCLNHGLLLSADQQSSLANMIDQLIAERIGLGPLEALLADENISEIMVNGPQSVYVERNGRLEPSNITFSSAEALLHIIDKIVSPIGRHIDIAMPMVDARLPDGSRLNAIIPPLSLIGPIITVRKFSKTTLSLADWVETGSLSRAAAYLLEVAIEQRLNIIISGGTGTGKTTLLNTLAQLIPMSERLITIEDSAELNIDHPHVVSLEARPPNQEGNGAISISDLVRNTLRMRPDRIIVGECRGAEALDMLQAMNTGHSGSITSLHANSARDAVRRLEVMVLMSGKDLPLHAIRQQIASAVHLVVQLERDPQGCRRIKCIAELTGIEGDVVLMNTMNEMPNSDVQLTHQLPEFLNTLSDDKRLRYQNLINEHLAEENYCHG